ncbi:MAG: hypothetical protein ACPGPC_17220 [Alphaproteobacteria bacterium]
MYSFLSKTLRSGVLALIVGVSTSISLPAQGQIDKKRNLTVLGCWGDADKGDSVDLKVHFVGNGSMVQYDENKVEKQKRSFGAWEMEKGSRYLKIFWPSGGTSQYHVKRIGPILHFAGMNGARSFTLRAVAPDNCWEPRT